MRTVVVGASSGLGRSIALGLAARGAQVAMLARRRARLDTAAREAGSSALAVPCDVTDDDACRAAIEESAARLGGIDALVYTPAIGPLGRLADVDGATWGRVFDTNVTGAARITAAAVPHLRSSSGAAVYLSSVSASLTPPWPGLGAYIVSKAALDKLVEAWRAEEPAIRFTRLTVGDCAGGEGDSQTEFAAGWDPSLAAEFGQLWLNQGLLAGALIDVDDLVSVVDGLLHAGSSLSLPTVTVVPRRQNDG